MIETSTNAFDETGEKPNVLVVDDEPQIRDMLCRSLSDAGCDCRTAGSAAEAWEMLHDAEFQVMILDISMPGGSGLDLLARVKASFRRAEVIMLTGMQETQTAIEALSVGASAYLIKPVARQELLFHIRRAIERRQLQLDRESYMQGLEKRVREQTREVRNAHEETIHRLMAASKYRDQETGAHIRRVGLLSEALAAALGWPTAQIDRIRMAAPMHDVGKIGIPDAILRKPGKLSPLEFEIMKTHSLIGARMLSGSTSPILQMAEQIACAHHERWDGDGYPHGIGGEQIPECARVVAVVDVFDALTHDRIYRPALCEREALELIQSGCGTHFEPRCVAKFMEILPHIRRIAAENSDNHQDDRAATNFQAYMPMSHAITHSADPLATPAGGGFISVHSGFRPSLAGSAV